MLAAAIVFCVYLYTLAPTVFPLDSAELTAAAYTLGLVHAPGYSVYLLLAHWFLYLPVGDVGYRANLFSALANASTVVLLTLLIKQISGRSLPALIAGLSFGFCFYAWSVSVIAEVYTFQGFLLVSLLLLLWTWRQKGQCKYLLLAVGIAGLSAVNNPATLLWWPGLLVLAWTTPYRRQLAQRDSLALVCVFALSLSPVLYLPWRSAAQPAFIYIGHYDTTGTFQPLDLTQPANLIWYLSGRQFASLFLAYTPAELVVEAVRFLHRLLAAFLGVGLPIGLWGAWMLWRQNRTLASGLVLTVLPHTLFFIAYRALDKDTMFLPVYLVWAILVGVGMNELLHMLPRRVAVVGLLLPLVMFCINLPFANVNNMWLPHDVAKARLRGATPNAVYLAAWGDAAAMQYHQIEADLRPDVTVVNVFFARPEVLMSLVEDTIADGRSVYTTLLEPNLLDHYQFAPVDHGYQIFPIRRKP